LHSPHTLINYNLQLFDAHQRKPKKQYCGLLRKQKDTAKSSKIEFAALFNLARFRKTNFVTGTTI